MAHITNGVIELESIHLYNVWYDNPNVGDTFNANIACLGGKRVYNSKCKVAEIGKFSDLYNKHKFILDNRDGVLIFLDDKSNKRWIKNKPGMIVQINGFDYLCLNHKPFSHGPREDGSIMDYDPEDGFID